MQANEEELKETVRSGARKQDTLNPQKYRYSKEFSNLPADNMHIVAIVLFSLHERGVGEIESNNFGSLGIGVVNHFLDTDPSAENTEKEPILKAFPCHIVL